MLKFAAKEKWAFAHSSLRAPADPRVPARTNSSAISEYSSCLAISNRIHALGGCQGSQRHLPSPQDGASSTNHHGAALYGLRGRSLYCPVGRSSRNHAEIPSSHPFPDVCVRRVRSPGPGLATAGDAARYLGTACPAAGIAFKVP